MNSFSVQIDTKNIRNKLLNYSKQFDTVFFYDSNAEHNTKSNLLYSSYDLLIGLGKNREIIFGQNESFEKLEQFHSTNKTWLFGYLSYDLKNETEDLQSNNNDYLELPTIAFVEPQLILALCGNELKISVLSNQHDSKIEASKIEAASELINQYIYSAVVAPQTSKQEYYHHFNALKAEIEYGNNYEINYCIAFNTKLQEDNYESLYVALNQISNAPFSAFVKVNNTVIVSASPERFLKKEGQKLISQPIKGTAKRGKTSEEDELLKHQLKHDKKERQENVMIVDLVRNDLSRTAARKSVQVEELFGIYSFKQVHQMISTVTCQLNDSQNYIKAIKNAFPMGSMTGAPKIKAMQLIEQHETMKRGLYSGALGYIDPQANFDFNVLIRTIIINTQNNKAQFCVGSAITHSAQAENEYQECLLKAKALFTVLGAQLPE